MHWHVRAVLLGTLAIGMTVDAPAQHGSAGRGGLAPSSTAIGAGALSRGPSSTARSSMPARASVFTPGYRYGSGIGRGGVTGSRGAYSRDYRRLPFAYWLAPYYYGYPFFDYGDTSYGPAGPGYDIGDDDNVLMAQNELAAQVQRLSAQVAQMQYGQQVPPPPNTEQQEQEPPEPPVTVVLRTGQQLQVENYAVMDQTFWDLSRQPVRKIPIASIDIAASTKATEAHGGEFPQVNSNQ